MILIGLCRRVPCSQTKSIPNLPHPFLPPLYASPSSGHFFSFHPLTASRFAMQDTLFRSRGGGEAVGDEKDRGGTRAPPRLSLRSDSSNKARARVGRTDHLTPHRAPLERRAVIAKRKYERRLGDKGRFQHVGGREGGGKCATTAKFYINPSFLSVCRAGEREVCPPDPKIPTLIPGGPC